MRAPFVEHASGDQNRKSAFVSGAVVETVCTLCHIRLSAYHRASPNVGWSRFRAVLMLDWILPASALRWNSTKVWKRNPSRCVNKISRPKRPLGYRRGGGPGQQPRPVSLRFVPHAHVSEVRSLSLIITCPFAEPLCSCSPLTGFPAEKKGSCPQPGGFGQ